MKWFWEEMINENGKEEQDRQDASNWYDSQMQEQREDYQRYSD